MNITGLPALVGTYDNYIWILHQDGKAWVVDAGQSEQVINFLQENKLELQGILVTHYHFDHTDGIPALKAAYPDATVYGPEKTENIYIQKRLKEGDQLSLTDSFTLNVFDTPGHTPDHIVFYNDQALFCADTLFTAGCGRLLGGTVEEFSASLLKLRDLPDSTPVYTAHEYTADNLKFAQIVEPENQALQARIAHSDIHYPSNLNLAQSTLKEEKETNPFLRFDKPQIKAQLLKRGATDRPASLFQALRCWKDQFDKQT
ncbi:MAG: hydroxyacylglutathione hydrolase [Thiomicrorhabdus sp.]|nr:MAG: hydroxyacylglutathione hydrolase [Thiomicrorhabdus sp.]